jgi:hypothetical protein
VGLHEPQPRWFLAGNPLFSARNSSTALLRGCGYRNGQRRDLHQGRVFHQRGTFCPFIRGHRRFGRFCHEDNQRPSVRPTSWREWAERTRYVGENPNFPR